MHAGWVDLAGFHRWRELYEAAAIAEGETAPDALRELAASEGIVVASTAPRAIASAKRLRDDVIVSPLLHELELRPPNLRGVKMPLFFWALTFGVVWLFRRTHATPAEHERARAAAEWLASLAHERGEVVAVTHATFRGVLAKALAAHGWEGAGKRGSHHWSVWTLQYNPPAK